MQPMPILYVSDMSAALRFVRTLAPAATTVTASPMWSQLDVDGAPLALHAAEDPGAIAGFAEIAFTAHEPLEEVAARLVDAGYELAKPIWDQAFGRSFQIRDPDGRPIQVNEHDPERYAG